MLKRYKICGNSMEPSLKNGDRVLVLKTRKVREKDLVVFTAEGKEMIKRIKNIQGDEFFVEGDNKESSTDSRDFGPIQAEQVIGKVLIRY